MEENGFYVELDSEHIDDFEWESMLYSGEFSNGDIRQLLREREAANKRIAGLEEQAKLYTALKDPQSVEAYAAIGLYIQRHFDAEKREQLFRLCGSMNYVEMSNRIKELEEQLRWIPMTESLPEEGELVLCGTNQFQFIAIYQLRTAGGDKSWINEYGISYHFDSITHWRSLPKPPKAEVSNA